jgi:lysophospholipase L1-like esterase
MPERLSRYVAVGDSFTEGLDDLRGDGTLRGWADRVADSLSLTVPDFQYANLAVRSLRIDAIVGGQIPAALAMAPDLVTVAAGGNDLLSLRASVGRVAAQFDDALAMLAAAGVTTLAFTGFDPRHQLPPGRLIAARTADYNALVTASARRYGALLVDLWSMPELSDSRFWSPDRLHLSSIGHAHIAGTVLDMLGRPTPENWPLRLGPPTVTSRVRSGIDDVKWSRRHLAPWAIRKIRGRATGDGRTAKYNSLQDWGSASGHDASSPSPTSCSS